MRRLRHLLSALIALFAISFVGCSSAKKIVNEESLVNLIIFYAPESGCSKLLEAAKKYGSRVLYVYKNINGIAVTIPNDKPATEAIKYFESIKGVLSVTEDRTLQPH